MGKCLRRTLGFVALLAVVVAGSACNKSKKAEAVSQGGDGPPFGMGGPPGMMGGGPGGPRGPIGQAMAKLFRGRQSLKDSIGRELNSDSPSWDTIQSQTKEFAELVASLSQYDPPKGSKDSWKKRATAFFEQAATLDRAAAAKNKSDALTAHKTILESCKSCHDAHRGGPGGMGGPPGRFGPPGGPPGFGPPGGPPGGPPQN